MRGRKPLPTALKVLRGTSTGPTKHKATIVNGAPPMPSWLDCTARREWRRICEILAKLGVLSPLDMAGLAIYCSAFSTFIRAQAEITKGGYVVLGSRGPVKSPWCRIADAAAETMRKFGAEFYLSPASRMRLDVTAADSADDEFEKFLAGGSK